MTSQFYITTSNVPEFQFLHILNNTWYYLFFNYSHPSELKFVL